MKVHGVLAPWVVQKINPIISGKEASGFPIDTNKSLKLSKMPETLTLR
jgi:hypothetical protein